MTTTENLRNIIWDLQHGIVTVVLSLFRSETRLRCRDERNQWILANNGTHSVYFVSVALVGFIRKSLVKTATLDPDQYSSQDSTWTIFVVAVLWLWGLESKVDDGYNQGNRMAMLLTTSMADYNGFWEASGDADYYAPGHYEMMGGVCLSVRPCVRPSVCLSVACLDLTRERKGLGNPKLADWPITWIIRQPV